MRLGGEIVDFVRLGLLNDPDQIGGVGQIAVVKDEAGVFGLRIFVKMLDPLGVEARGTALDPVDDVTSVEQELSEIGAVLTGHAGDQGYFRLTHGALFI